MEFNEINVSDISSGQRYREDYGDIHALAESIKTYGVIQPLAVRKAADGIQLIAGGRRLAAIKEAGIETVPVRIYEELTEEEYRSIELEENIQRKDLTWLEICQLQREIHELRIKVHGERKHSMDKDGWSMTDTAELLGKDRTGINKDIQLANAVEEFDDVDWSECKTKNDAIKQLSRLQEGMARRELARRYESSSNSTLRKKLSDSFILMDAVEGMSKLESEIADLVEIDPPYAINLHKMKKDFDKSYSIESYNEIDEDKYFVLLEKLLLESFRIMKPDSWLVLWHAPEPWSELIYNAITNAQLKTTRLTGKWIKPSGQSMQPSYNLSNAVEEFFYAHKGRPILAKPGRSNVFNYSPVYHSSKTHPTERPVALMQDIIETFSFENSQVIVPCCGSGNTIIASYLSGRKAFGYELSEEYKESFVITCNQLF